MDRRTFLKSLGIGAVTVASNPVKALEGLASVPKVKTADDVAKELITDYCSDLSAEELRNVMFLPGFQEGYVASSEGIVAKTIDGGESWQVIKNG